MAVFVPDRLEDRRKGGDSYSCSNQHHSFITEHVLTRCPKGAIHSYPGIETMLISEYLLTPFKRTVEIFVCCNAYLD